MYSLVQSFLAGVFLAMSGITIGIDSVDCNAVTVTVSSVTVRALQIFLLAPQNAEFTGEFEVLRDTWNRYGA